MNSENRITCYSMINEALTRRPMSREEIRSLALKHGFHLKEQMDGTMDLNEYVYAFVYAILAVPEPEGKP